MTGVWRRVRVCVVPVVEVEEDAGWGGVHGWVDGVVVDDAVDGMGRAFRKTQFLYSTLSVQHSHTYHYTLHK